MRGFSHRPIINCCSSASHENSGNATDIVDKSSARAGRQYARMPSATVYGGINRKIFSFGECLQRRGMPRPLAFECITSRDVKSRQRRANRCSPLSLDRLWWMSYHPCLVVNLRAGVLEGAYPYLVERLDLRTVVGKYEGAAGGSNHLVAQRVDQGILVRAHGDIASRLHDGVAPCFHVRAAVCSHADPVLGQHNRLAFRHGDYLTAKAVPAGPVDVVCLQPAVREPAGQAHPTAAD